ncbi:MAG: CRISPR-associated protein Cas4 [Candidatus Aminicenantaceae bacterium]
MINEKMANEILLKRPHLIEDFFICRYRAYLHLIGIYVQDDRLLRIGRSYQEQKPNSLVHIDRYDPWRGEMIEIKKRDFGLAEEMQTYAYLKLLNAYGFSSKKAILTSKEKRKKKIIEFPNEAYEKLFLEAVREMGSWITPPKKVRKSICKNCSMKDYCWG